MDADQEKVALHGVCRTAIITLRARAAEHQRNDGVLTDPAAVEWLGRVEWPPALDAWYGDSTQTNLALRAADIDAIIRRYAASADLTSVVELGVGLSTRAVRMADLGLRWIGVDLPEVIDLRRAWNAPDRTVPGSVLDDDWLSEVEASTAAAPLFVAEGLLYYLPRASVDALLSTLADRFDGAPVIMDVIGRADFADLERRTAALGTPVEWCLEGDFAAVLDAFGLGGVDGFSPDDLLFDAMRRYLPRLSPAARAMSWWALQTRALPPTRSGNILGRLIRR